MPVALNGSTSGSVTITAPAVAGTTTLTLPSTSGTFNISGVANEVPAGSAAAPSIYSTGDTNTGIFFPAADTIAFAEGGVEAMRIASDGNVSFGGTAAMSSSFLRNRIINGDMRVFQRAANATTNASYSVDRWALGFVSTGTTQLGQSQLFPAGYTSSLIFDVGTADTSIAAGEHAFMYQPIEGNNIFDLSWGGASAKSVTLSFWVYTTTIGTFCVALRNSPATLSYIAEYTVNVANTWEYKTVTVPGPTTGTWATDNATGLIVAFTVAVGTTFQTTANAWNSGNFLGTSNQVNLLANTANEFRVTGVQLEEGTVATPFERQIYSNQFAQCMRYYIDARQSTTGSTLGMTGNITSGTNYHFSFSYPVPMRASPTLTWVEWTSSGFPGTSATFQQTGYLGSNVYKTANATMSGGYFLGGYTASAEL